MNKASNKIIAKAIVAEITNGTKVQDVAQMLAAYLIQERRIGDINAILRDIQRLILETESKLYVKTISAKELTVELENQIKEIFINNTGSKSVVIQQEINPVVVGGVRCETADQRLDLTVRRQLQRLKTTSVVT